MENTHEEQVIYLKDLLFSVLYRWKKVLFFGLILAVLLGGMKGIPSYLAAKNDTSAPPQQVEENEESALLKSKIASLQASIDHLTAYRKESVLMQIDPYDFYKASFCAYISTDYQIMPGMDYQTPDLSNVILNSYSIRLASEDLMQILSEQLNIKPQYAKELITITTNDNTHMLSVSATYPTEEGAQALMDILIQYLEQLQPEVSQAVQSHQLNIYQQAVSHAQDKALSDLQTQNIQSILDLHTSLRNAQAALDAAFAAQPTPASMRSTLKSTVIFGIIGFILGAFIVVAVIWVNHFARNTVYSSRTLTNRTQLKVLGSLNTIAKMDKLTRVLRRLDNRNLTESSQQAQLIAANVQNLCADKKHLLVTGSVSSAVLSDALKQAMPGAQISVCGSLLSDVAAVNALSLCDCVLLVEECDVSLYTDIQQTTAMIADNKKLLLGCVLLNG